MTLEIIVFILAILFGILFYWRESKSNKLYRFFNKLTHSKELQMQPNNRKGFFHEQPFLLRLVWVSLLFLSLGVALTILIPFAVNYLQYFVAAIVGSLIGTYIASMFLFAQEKTKKEHLEKVFEKGKDIIEDISEDVKESFVTDKKPAETIVPKPAETPKKSARDRLKDKGMIK
jgi:Na+/H+ antiporter NhaC